MSDHPKYGHLPRCPKDTNKLCDYLSLQVELGKASEENKQLRKDLKFAEDFINEEGKKLEAIQEKWRGQPKTSDFSGNVRGFFEAYWKWVGEWEELMDE